MKKNNDVTYENFISQYIFDKEGKKTGMILSVEAFEALIDDIEDYYEGQMAEAALQDKEGALTHEEFLKLLTRS